jgi:hypothetical protein
MSDALTTPKAEKSETESAAIGADEKKDSKKKRIKTKKRKFKVKRLVAGMELPSKKSK